ncbi:37450_t:CDS:2, partial [Gigaspora margarita]
ADQYRLSPSSFVPNNIVRVSSQGHQSVEGFCETGPYSLGQVDCQQFSPVSYGSPPHFYTHHSPENFITNGFSMSLNAVQQSRTRNVGELSPIINTLGPLIQYPSVICPVPVLMTIYACPCSNVQVQHSCEHSALPINDVHQSVGGLYEPYQTGFYNSDQADWQQVSPVSCGSPSHFYIHHSQNNFIRNESPMPINEGPHQMLVSSGRENNSRNSSTIASQSKDLTVKWAYYMNRTL